MKRKLRRFIELLAVVSVLAACGGTPATSTPTTAPASEATMAAPTDASTPANTPTEATSPTEEAIEEPTTEATEAPTTAVSEESTTVADETTSAGELSDDELRVALQTTVDAWSEAYSTGDIEALDRVVDPKALTLKRTQRELVTYFYESIGGSSRDWGGTVGDIRRRDMGYVVADVDISGARYTFTFKEVEGEWRVSEPRRAELGKKTTLETEHFIIEYYPWDTDVAEQLGPLMEEARTIVHEKMDRDPETKPLVKLIPTAEVSGGRSGRALASYQRGQGANLGKHTMVVNSPSSLGFGGYPSDAGWEPDLRITLAHEFAHLVNNCCYTPIARMQDWMVEGLAEYVSEGGKVSRQGTVALSVQNDAIIPIQDTSGERVDKQDLEHLTLLDQDISLAYGLSSSIVDYIARNYGGMDGWWKLIGDFDQTQDFDQSSQNVLGITLADFEKAWQDDLKKQFGG